MACKVLNCTWDITEPQDGYGWGVKPISGPYNQSGVWGGVLGGIINGGNLLRGIDNCLGTSLSVVHTPPIAEILCVKSGRAIVVCGFLMK